MAGELAPYLDGIPTVADASTRDVRFPSGTRVQNQRVYRLDTAVIERWSGSAWVQDVLGSTATTSAISVAVAAEAALRVAGDAATLTSAQSYTDGKIGVGTASPEGVLTSAVGKLFVQSDATNGPVTWRKAKGTDAYGWAPVTAPLPIALPYSLTTFGDSFTAGQGASPSTESYANVLATALGAAIVNLGVSGTGTYTAIANAYNAGVAFVPRPAGYVVSWMAGYNDLRRNGAVTKTLAKMEHGLRAFLAYVFSSTNVAANDAAVTAAGTWTTFAPAGAITRASVLSGLAKSGVLGNTLSWTFTGDSLVIGTWVADGVNQILGPATITVDGVLQATFDPNGKTDGVADSAYNNQQTPSAIVIRGLGSGSHTVVVAPTHATNPFVVDYFSTLVSAASAPPALIATVCRDNATGYATPPAFSSDAAVATASNTLYGVMREFLDYPVVPVFPNTLFDVATGISGDDIHPNNLGHFQIARAFLAGTQGAAIPIFKGPGTQSLQIGRLATTTLAGGVAIGDTATASGLNAMAIGANTVASATSAMAIGGSAAASASGATSLGVSSSVNQVDSTAVGALATVTGGVAATAIGKGAAASSDNTVALGQLAAASATRATALGSSAAASASHASALGCLAAATHADSTAVGYGAATTAINQVMLGTATETVTSLGNVKLGGSGKTVGFYGVTPVARAAAITTPNTQTAAYVQADVQSIKTAVDAIRVALQNIGVTL